LAHSLNIKPSDVQAQSKE